MGAAAGSDAVAGGVAGPGAGGIVSRPRLFERLGASARVTVISAPPGSGKTVLLRAMHRVAVTAVPADLSRTEQVSRVTEHAAGIQVDVLVNNAGFGTYGDFAGLDPGREHAEVMVNAVAAVDLARAALPGMLARGRGGIITVASAIAFQPSPHQAVYGATKAFALAFSEALWAETRGTGVRILALCPGPVATGFLASLGDQAAASSIIYRRTADPADVVRAGLRGFDHDAMTITPGLRTRVRAQGHRFLPRTVMARLTGKMLAPAGR